MADYFWRFWAFLTIFGDFFLKRSNFSEKNQFLPKNPESAIKPVRHIAFPPPPYNASLLYNASNFGLNVTENSQILPSFQESVFNRSQDTTDSPQPTPHPASELNTSTSKMSSSLLTTNSNAEFETIRKTRIKNALDWMKSGDKKNASVTVFFMGTFFLSKFFEKWFFRQIQTVFGCFMVFKDSTMIMEARKVRKQPKIIDFSNFSIFLRFFSKTRSLNPLK